MFKTNLFLLILLSGCTNLRHFTNTNLSSVTQFHNRDDFVEEVRKEVALRKASEVKSCDYLGEFKGKDNVVEQGEEYSILYFQLAIYNEEGNAAVIKKTKEIGDYGHLTKGKGYSCK